MKRNLLLEYRVKKLEKLLLEKAVGTLPKYFYHGTTRKNAERIKQQGLRIGGAVANHSLSNVNCIYMTDNIDGAKSWAHQAGADISNIIVFSIDSRYLNPDLISYDANAVALDYDGYGYEDDEEQLEIDFQNALDPDFNDESYYSDYTYTANIPAKALEVVWPNDEEVENIQQAESLLDNEKWNEIFSSWDSLKDIELTNDIGQTVFSYDVAYAFHNMLNPHSDIKYRNPILKSIYDLKKIPAKVLNTIIKDKHSISDRTVLTAALAYTPFVDDTKLADTFTFLSELKGLDSNNATLLFSKFLSKPKQGKFISMLESLPTEFLMKAKPAIAKKYWSQLGI